MELAGCGHKLSGKSNSIEHSGSSVNDFFGIVVESAVEAL
jgi:hypothetical protein